MPGRLTVSADEMNVRYPLGKIRLTPDDVIAFERVGWIPWLTLGLRVQHNAVSVR